MALNIRNTILQALMQQDGVEIPKTGGAERMIRCVNPHHEDNDASMSLNVAKGVYNCHNCHARGNAYTYLTDIRGLPTKEAVELLKSMGATEDNVVSFEQEKQKQTSQKNRRPYWTEHIPEKVKVTRGKSVVYYTRVDSYEYPDASGRLACRVVLYVEPPENVSEGKKPKKESRPFTPCSTGGYWWCGPLNEQLPDEDRAARYPLYNAQEIFELTDRLNRVPDATRTQIWFVEGEKCVEWVRKCPGAPNNKPPPVTTMLGGTPSSKANNIAKHDLTPLYGQRVLLLADADSSGRSHMKRIGRELAKNNAEVRYLLPSGDDGWDVADAIAAGGWKGILKWVEDSGGILEHDDVSPPEREQPASVPSSFMADTPYFRVIGQEGDAVVLQSKVTSKMHRLRAGSLNTDGVLISIAPLAYWQSLTKEGKVDSAYRLVWADAIMRASEERGEINSMSKSMWQRGAVVHGRDRVSYNLGDGVLLPDKDNILSVKRSLVAANAEEDGEIFLPGQPIRMKDDPKAREYCQDLYKAVTAYKWEVPEHGDAFCGWLVSSLIGGALEFRPMLWLTAEAGAGKTFVFNDIVKAVFGPLATDLADATEAGLASISQDSALPCYLDEFEPEKGKERRMSDILSLVRVATSGAAGRVRGNATGGFSIVRPRFSLMVGSVNRPKLNEANDSRFVPIRLTERSVKDWPAVREAIYKATEEDRSLIIRTRIIRYAAKIREVARKIEDQLVSQNVKTRDAQIRGALSAGVRFLSGDHTFVLPPRDRRVEDLFRPMSVILTCMVRTSDGVTMTLGEALYRGSFNDDGQYVDEGARFFEQKELATISKRYGFAFDGPDELLIAANWPPTADLLAKTEFENLDFGEYVQRLPGAHRDKDKRKRIKFGNLRRDATSLPRETLEQIGFFDGVGSGQTVSDERDDGDEIPW